MADALTRLRSVLFMPAANARALEKAKQIPADALILDLEDAVAPAAKPEARERAAGAVAGGAYGERVVAIRINAIDSEWHDADLRAAAAAGPHAVVVPKVGSAAEIIQIEAALIAAGAPAKTRIWAMIESPAAVLAAPSIASSSERLAVLLIGANDLVKELYAEHIPGREPLLASLSLCVLAARAAGKMILDGVYNDLDDAEGFASECAQGRRLGFDGKTLIHPSQVEVCNASFSPSAAELEHARRVIAAFEQAEPAGAGVVTLDGRMIEHLHVESARRTLTLADA